MNKTPIFFCSLIAFEVLAIYLIAVVKVAGNENIGGLLWLPIFIASVASYFIFNGTKFSLAEEPLSNRKAVIAVVTEVLKHFMVGFVTVMVLCATVGAIEGYFFSDPVGHNSNSLKSSEMKR